ncbi:hypothetical protein B0H11DRAFT_2222232 [Mycena galericulata]|nr:hypothetical protein B0H11DRAFT_2222232 [Mycena galericulata]
MDDLIANVSEAERVHLMSQLRNIRDPFDAAEATFNLRLYKPTVPGKVYVHARANKEVLAGLAFIPADEDVDHVDLKHGRTNDIDRRRGEYARKCKGEEIIWCYYYETQHTKLLERLVHLSLRHAKRHPYACHGCGVKHCEHFAEEAAGGLEGIAEIIEYWLRRLGEPLSGGEPPMTTSGTSDFTVANPASGSPSRYPAHPISLPASDSRTSDSTVRQTSPSPQPLPGASDEPPIRGRPSHSMARQTPPLPPPFLPKPLPGASDEPPDTPPSLPPTPKTVTRRVRLPPPFPRLPKQLPAAPYSAPRLRRVHFVGVRLPILPPDSPNHYPPRRTPLPASDESTSRHQTPPPSPQLPKPLPAAPYSAPRVRRAHFAGVRLPIPPSRLPKPTSAPPSPLPPSPTDIRRCIASPLHPRGSPNRYPAPYRFRQVPRIADASLPHPRTRLLTPGSSTVIRRRTGSPRASRACPTSPPPRPADYLPPSRQTPHPRLLATVIRRRTCVPAPKPRTSDLHPLPSPASYTRHFHLQFTQPEMKNMI